MLPAQNKNTKTLSVIQVFMRSLSASKKIICAQLLLVGTLAIAADDPWYQALSEADKRIQTFERAVDAGDKVAMQRAALDLQADPIAVKRFNQASTDAYRTAHNTVTDGIKARTRELMRETIARERGVRPDQVTTFEATNPPKPGDPIKVGQDWDVTVRVDGVDVHHTVSGQHVNDAFYEAVNGNKPPNAKAANALAHRQAIEVTSYQHPEAYGGAQSEGGKIIGDPGGSPTLRDPEQLGNTIDFKSRLPGNEAARLEAAGKFVEAQGFRMEQARQAAKQFDRQVAVRVSAMGGTVPPHVKKAMDIMRDIGDGKITPTQGQKLLAAMGESIDSVASKSAGLIEAAQTVRPGGLGAADDVFVTNAKNRMRSKGLDPDNLKPLSPKADIADFRKGSSSVARSWASVGMATLEAVGWAADFYELAQAAKKYLQMFDKAMDPNISDEEAQKYFAKMKEAANDITLLGGMGVLFEAYPPAAAVFGVYTISRLGLENTETGKAIDNAGFVIADTTFQVAEKAVCNMKEFVGIENVCAQMADQNRDKLLTYLRAIRAGKLVLLEPYDAKDLGKAVMLGNPTDNMIMRVDELERLKKANAAHEALLAKLAAARSQCEALDAKRIDTLKYHVETAAREEALRNDDFLLIAKDNALSNSLAQCKFAKDTSAEVGELTEKVMSLSNTAQRAYSGAIDRLRICRYKSDIEEAQSLTEMGRGVAGNAASKAITARIGYDRLGSQLAAADEARDSIAGYRKAQGPFDLRVKALSYRVETIASMRGQVSALESACQNGIAAASADIRSVVAQLPESETALRSQLDAIAALAKDNVGYSETKAQIPVDDLKQMSAYASEGLSKANVSVRECTAIDSREANMAAMNTAIRALPDTQLWLSEVATMTSDCQRRLDDRDDDDKDKDDKKNPGGDTGGGNGDDTGGDSGGNAGGNPDDEDGRGDYEGYDEDGGNVDEERVAENGMDTETVREGWRPEDGEDRAQNSAGEGDLMDPAYREDRLADAERHREDAETAERIAAREGDRRRGRGRGGNDSDIEGEFGDAPDIDQLPNPEEDEPKDEPKDRQPPGKRGERGERGEREGDKNGGSPRATPDTRVPTIPPNVVPPGTKPDDGPDDTPDKVPGTKPGQTPPKPDYDAARCKAIAAGLESQVPHMTNNMKAFQAAAKAKDEEAAQKAGCKLLDQTSKILDVFTNLKNAKCPIEGDVQAINQSVHRTRSEVNRAMPRQCGTPPPIGRFEATWSAGSCPQVGIAGKRWHIQLKHRGDKITGRINFHACPGGGRLEYALSGTDNGKGAATLRGTLVSSRGPLAETASRSVTFNLAPGRPPSPNFAP